MASLSDHQFFPSGDNLEKFSGKPKSLVSGATTAMHSLSDFSAAVASKTLADAVPGKLEDVEMKHARRSSDSMPIVEINGKVPGGKRGDELHFFAAAPAERRATAAGSGIPYANAEQAFDSTPNKGTLRLDEGGAFRLRMVQPNAFYAGLGTRYVPPAVHLWYARNGKKMHIVIRTGNGVPFRSLTYPSLPTRPRRDATFYAPTPVVPRSQQQIFQESAYPSDTLQMPPNFWGLRPPV